MTTPKDSVRRRNQRHMQSTTHPRSASENYTIGLISSDEWENPVGAIPQIPASVGDYQPYRFETGNRPQSQSERANIHLLAAQGTFDEPFVPVKLEDDASSESIRAITSIEVEPGKVLRPADDLWIGRITCVDAIRLTARTSDGKTFSSQVDLAVEPQDDGANGPAFNLYVTPQGRTRFDAGTLYQLLGGYVDFDDESSVMDVQAEEFVEKVNRYWVSVDGPGEWFRSRIMKELEPLGRQWKTVTATADGRVTITYADGSESTLTP